MNIATGALIRPTYRASTVGAFAAAAGAAMFFVITGSTTKTLIVQRIRVSGPTLTAVAYHTIACEKWSSAPSGGTATALTKVPLDSGTAAGTATLCQVYTVAPTEGSLVGTLGVIRHLAQATVAVAAGPVWVGEFDFRTLGGSTGVFLRGSAEAVSLAFGAAPATAVTLSVEVEWIEL